MIQPQLKFHLVILFPVACKITFYSESTRINKEPASEAKLQFVAKNMVSTSLIQETLDC